MKKEELPIDGVMREVVAALEACSGVVVCAPPGAGKTTRVPRGLLDAGYGSKGDILILEPRRLAARLAAARVAAELDERLGETVGYSIRFENVAGPKTRIRFLTEGILARRIVQDQELSGVSAVILDEFHERHLTTDLALAFLRRLQSKRRPDLKLLVMSATLDPGPVAEFLGGVPILQCEGARYSLTFEYEERQMPLHERVAAGFSRLHNAGLDGDVLVFLPGAAEIRQAAEALQPLAARTHSLVLPLHGDLPAAAQSRAVQPSDQRKLILATNVAETSITIPGVAAVIDSGLARVAAHSAWTGLPVLALGKISRASAAQRAGRAGRTRDGKVLRLYSRHDFECRPERDVPEIRRADLAESTLILHGAGIGNLRSFAWFEPPAEASLKSAEELLSRLGALDPAGAMTQTGVQMLRFPLHPRLARLLVEGERRNVADECCVLTALLTERDIRLSRRSEFSQTTPGRGARNSGPSDLLELLDRFHEAEQARFEPERLRALALDPRSVDSVERTRRQLARIVKKRTGKAAPPKESEEDLLIAILTAFPDRVARRRAPASREFLLAAGGAARLDDGSVVHRAPLIIAADAEERTGAKGTRDSAGILIRLASAVEPEWLAGLFPAEISEKTTLTWNDRAGRVDEAVKTLFGNLTLEETIRPASRSDDVSALLLSQALARGWAAFRDGAAVPSLKARIALLTGHFPAAGFTRLDDSLVEAACAECCAGKRSLAELEASSLTEILISKLTSRQRDLLAKETPERITLRAGRKVAVHYETGKPPWIESALQDFFGMRSTPAICAGRVPLTVHLLAPNRRPVQVTQDLPGFWERHYPALRRQLQRRYPKHHWPEQP